MERMSLSLEPAGQVMAWVLQVDVSIIILHASHATAAAAACITGLLLALHVVHSMHSMRHAMVVCMAHETIAAMHWTHVARAPWHNT